MGNTVVYENLNKHRNILERIAYLSNERYFNGKVNYDVEFFAIQGGNILEEASEILKRIYSHHERIDGLMDIVVFSIGTMVHLVKSLNYEDDIEVIHPVETIGDTISLFFTMGYKGERVPEDIVMMYSRLVLAAINLVEIEGYDSIKCLEECLEEISSREQDPIQKLDGRKPGEKWLKWKKQPEDTLYKADYAKFKR